jgi:hypothetical protein
MVGSFGARRCQIVTVVYVVSTEAATIPRCIRRSQKQEAVVEGIAPGILVAHGFAFTIYSMTTLTQFYWLHHFDAQHFDVKTARCQDENEDHQKTWMRRTNPGQ